MHSAALHRGALHCGALQLLPLKNRNGALLLITATLGPFEPPSLPPNSHREMATALVFHLHALLGNMEPCTLSPQTEPNSDIQVSLA